jgi:uncharacterized protein (DUF305 family)
MAPAIKVKAATTVRHAIFSALMASATMAGHGIASAQTPMAGHPGMAPGMAMPAGKSPMQMHAAMEDMQKKVSSMTMTGKTDIDFAMMMVAHHQAAIDMAKAELETGKDPAMLSMAKKIIAAQTKEIAQLETWLKKNPHAM